MILIEYNNCPNCISKTTRRYIAYLKHSPWSLNALSDLPSGTHLCSSNRAYINYVQLAKNTNIFFFIFMYVRCFTYVVLISNNSAKKYLYIHIFYFNNIYIISLLHVSIHLYHLYGVPELNYSKVT